MGNVSGYPNKITGSYLATPEKMFYAPALTVFVKSVFNSSGEPRKLSISEVLPSHKEELNTALTSLQNKLKHTKKMKAKCDKTVQHIKSQAEHTERQIKEEFEKLRQFLRDEEEATITALREEEEQKQQMMKEKLEEMNRHISALSHTIKDTEEMMKASDACFLK
ncbi:tripartite motif-containing protein 35-like, partial [Sinocyclocheilus grahami]|uniref:tripartite motif-containing protein 35-like n=1 Tax=Sinocyclocheilus grahami TaxID=75366 RepID=UPI0007AC83E4